MHVRDGGLRLSGEELAALVEDARRRTHALVADLSDLELEVPSRPEVNPTRWELGHIAHFFEVFFLRELGASEPVLDGADDWFDSFRVAHDTRWSLGLPDRSGILRYMEDVATPVLARLRSTEPASATETYLALLCTLHEDMHGEALTYTRQTLEYRAPELEGTRSAPAAGSLAGYVDVPGGDYALGAAPGEPFVFDNEKWEHPVPLEPFRIARAPVTNRQFAEFVDDGGYQRRELWSAQGWHHRQALGLRHPVYWLGRGDVWMSRVYDRVVPIVPDAPVVHVSWYEAEAYCRWAGRRLPSEAEWEMAAVFDPATGGKRRFPWGDAEPSGDRANLDSAFGGVVDVAAFPESDSPCGARQMMGNVWEWTSSPFYPFPGYLVDHPYREYSAPWFGYHKVLRGGAWATRSRLARPTYRNFFLPHRADVFAGFRTCSGGKVDPAPTDKP